MRILITTLLITAATGGIASAQTSGSPVSSETPDAILIVPNAGAPASSDASESGTMQQGQTSTMQQSEGGFYTYQRGNQMLGSGLMGARVMGASGDDIGEVEDLLLDRNGQVMAVVVGIGGFLGIGEKDVAIANDQLQFVLQDAEVNSDAATGTSATADAATSPPAGTTPAPAGGTSSTGMAGSSAGAPTSPGMMTTPANGRGAGLMDYGWNWNGAGIDHIEVQFTREQLEDAPAFEYVS